MAEKENKFHPDAEEPEKNKQPKDEIDVDRRKFCKTLAALAGMVGAKVIGCSGRPVGIEEGCDAGPEGCDAGPEGCDAGPEGCDAGPEGCDAIPEGCDAGPEGCDAGPEGCDAGPEGCTGYFA